ncbi:glycosyltransferase family 92 protein [Methanorbis furvi]|uniref:Glycosyltransferase family 92 protein n=1 Tax=Methanorbis furvi TaxID=3028299 RepID=A0AAE4MD69_9EURY|nr:hypothetical protein [Methanocorpusculaceae archaeon Ag1]
MKSPWYICVKNGFSRIYACSHYLCFSVRNFFKFGKRKYRDYLSIVAVIKDEAPYLREWIEFHKLIGVDKFYLYDAATDNTKEILAPYINSGEVVYRIMPGKSVQIPAYNDAICKYRSLTRWLAVVDADEFIVPVGQFDTVTDFLKNYEDYPAVGVNWIMYDSNGHVTKPDGLVIKNYTRVHADDNHKDNHLIKSIVDPCRVMWCGQPHYCHYSWLSHRRKAVTENYNEINMGSYSEYNSVCKIRICHYYSKSKEEFEKKCKRGMADSNQYRTVSEEQYNYSETKQDYTMMKYVERMEEILLTK